MMPSILFGVPLGYLCHHAPWHAFVEIFEVLWSDGPPDLLCDFDDSRSSSLDRFPPRLFP